MSELNKPAEQFKNNIELLQAKGELGVFFGILYEAAVNVQPELGDVVIRPSGASSDPILAETGGYAVHSGESRSGSYEVVVNLDNGLGHYERLRELRRSSMEDNARRIGIHPDAFDAKALAGFVFLHEIGHIVDFIKNAPDLAAHNARRQLDMDSLPIPKYNPVVLIKFLQSPPGIEWYEKARQAIETNFGVATPEELIGLQDAAYRQLPTEAIPDTFAASVLRPFL